VKTNLPIIISKPCKDLVNDKRVIADKIGVLGLKSKPGEVILIFALKETDLEVTVSSNVQDWQSWGMIPYSIPTYLSYNS